MQSTSRPSSSSPPSLPAVSSELLSSSFPTNAPESSSRDLAPKQNQFTINVVLFDEKKKKNPEENLPANGDQLATLRSLSKFFAYLPHVCMPIYLPQAYTPTRLLFEPRRLFQFYVFFDCPLPIVLLLKRYHANVAMYLEPVYLRAYLRHACLRAYLHPSSTYSSMLKSFRVYLPTSTCLPTTYFPV